MPVSVRPSATGRCAAIVVLAVIAAGLLGGCKAGNVGGARQREVVVDFEPPFTDAQRQDVLTKCSGLPAVTPEPLATAPASSRVNVRFAIGTANDEQLSALYSCLARLTADSIRGPRIVPEDN